MSSIRSFLFVAVADGADALVTTNEMIDGEAGRRPRSTDPYHSR